jgi:large subunit ribosomal protein L22
MRLVGDMVKGMPVEKALNVLNFTPKIAAHHLAKTVKSAAANALSIEGTDHLKPEALMVKDIIVDAAPMAKRIRFQSMGRVFRIRKRHCHLTVLLEGATDIEATTTTGPKARGKAKAEESEAAEPKKTAEKPAKKTTRATKAKSDKSRKGATALKKTHVKQTTAKKTGQRGQ